MRHARDSRSGEQSHSPGKKSFRPDKIDGTGARYVLARQRPWEVVRRLGDIHLIGQ